MHWLATLYTLTLVTSLSGMEFVSAVVLVNWLWHGFKDRRLHLPLWKPILLFSIIVVVGIWIGRAAEMPQKWQDVARLRFFLFFWASCDLLSKVQVRRWLIPFSILFVVICIYSTLQHFFPIDWVRPEGKKIILFADGDVRGPLVVGFFNHHLTFSNIFGLYAPIFLSYGFYRFPKNILFWGLSFWVYLLCLWSGSRSAWIATPLSILVIAIGKSWRWKEPLLALFASAVVVVVLTVTNPPLRQRFLNTFDLSHAHQSLTPRWKLWHAQWEFFKESPLFGVGWNNNERRAEETLSRLYPGQSNMAGHAHSMPLQILATTGLLGFSVFLVLWGCIFSKLKVFLTAKYASREERWLALGLFGAFVALWIQGLTQWNFGDAEVLHNIMFLWGLGYCMQTGRNV